MKKIINDEDLFSPGTFVCMDGHEIIGFIATKLSPNILPEYQKAAWLSTLCVDQAHRRMGLGSLMYKKAEDALKKAGVKNMIVAGEMNNFFSGIPSPSQQSRLFFSKLGFELNDREHYDLSADVSAIDFDRLAVQMNRGDEFITKPLAAGDIPALERFFDNEFPGRWKYEIMRYIKNSGDLNQVIVLCKAQEVKGFCKVFVSHGISDDFTVQLGSDWGGLGPIGIANDIRGMGLGNRILCDSLKHLKMLGVHTVNIDWTVLKEFYGQFGFTPWRTYLGAYKSI